MDDEEDEAEGDEEEKEDKDEEAKEHIEEQQTIRRRRRLSSEEGVTQKRAMGARGRQDAPGAARSQGSRFRPTEAARGTACARPSKKRKDSV